MYLGNSEKYSLIIIITYNNVIKYKTIEYILIYYLLLLAYMFCTYYDA